MKEDLEKSQKLYERAILIGRMVALEIEAEHLEDDLLNSDDTAFENDVADVIINVKDSIRDAIERAEGRVLAEAGLPEVDND